MILDGSVGARWTASAMATSRPSPATSTSPRRTTSTTLPSSRIRRVSRSAMATPSRSSLLRRSGGSARAGEPALVPVEPVVHLPGADGVLVLAVAATGGGAVALAERPHHHQVVPEAGLGLEAVELGHRVQHPCMVTGL